ncbi:hypothetical protein AYI69_g1372 [Smittium culicis]|nr:hypothetical protein AYI69_g1372 [Smittium culicis]
MLRNSPTVPPSMQDMKDKPDPWDFQAFVHCESSPSHSLLLLEELCGDSFSETSSVSSEEFDENSSPAFFSHSFSNNEETFLNDTTSCDNIAKSESLDAINSSNFIVNPISPSSISKMDSHNSFNFISNIDSSHVTPPASPDQNSVKRKHSTIDDDDLISFDDDDLSDDESFNLSETSTNYISPSKKQKDTS